MKINEFKRFKYGVTVLCNHCSIFDVYMIDIDEDRIELSDSMGMVIGTIDTDQLNECTVINYDNNSKMIELSNLGVE